MKLILPFPPSVNTYWRHPNKGAFAGKSLISAAGRKFQSAACAAIVEQLRRLPKPTSAPASVEIVLFPPDISGSVNANSGTLNNVTINQNCTIKGMLEATQVRGDFVKAVSKAFPKKVGTWGNTETPNGTVTVTISDDHNFDRQIIIPPIIFNGIAYSDPGSGNNPGGTRYTGYGFEVRKNGVLIASRETKGAIPGSYSAVIDMPSGRGSVTLEFKIFQKGNQGAGNITDCTVIVTKKAASGISIR